MLERILELAKKLYPASGGQEIMLENLCRIACQRLDSRLKEGVTAEDCAEAYITAAVWLALDEMSNGGLGGQVQRFSAGDLTIETGGSSQGLERRAWSLMRPYLKDTEFVFRGVRS